jgi:hypothetical protein
MVEITPPAAAPAVTVTKARRDSGGSSAGGVGLGMIGVG